MLSLRPSTAPSSVCELSAGDRRALNRAERHWLMSRAALHLLQPGALMPKHYYRIILIVLTVACGLGAIIAAPIALLTAAMGFAPDSGYQLWAWIVFFVVLSIPLWFVIGAVAGWLVYVQGWRRTSLVLAATPLGAAAAGWLLLQLA
jgi:hypothetical protein